VSHSLASGAYVVNIVQNLQPIGQIKFIVY
jgi:hypothetical protein